MTSAKYLLWFAVFAVLVTPIVRGEAEKAADKDSGAESDVHVLTEKNFDSFLKEHPVALVEFYAPWCGHCKALTPHYEEAATKLKKRADGVVLAKVDATAEKELANRFEVRGYPTMKLFKNGEPTEYTGGRTADTIISWIDSVTGPAVEIVDEASVKRPETGVMFAAHLKQEDGKERKLYEKVAEKLRMSAKFVAHVSPKGTNKVTVYRGEDELLSTDIGTDEEALEKWVSEEMFPFFGPIDGENYAAYEGRPHEIVWFAGTPKDYKSNSKAIQETAKQFRDVYSFVWLDTERFGSHAENGLGISKLPGLVLRLREGGRYLYPEDNKFVAKDMIKFFQDVKAGKVEKFLKSEPIPETNDDPVKVVVGKNFDDMVFRKDQDVLLEIYAPWCGHCKRLEPIYNELAEKLADHKHIVIAKMDGTANEPPSTDFNYRGFPTLFWVKAGSTKPVTYSDARTLEGLLNFIKSNSSKPVDVAVEETEADEEVKDEL